jgi:hypothetical protein
VTFSVSNATVAKAVLADRGSARFEGAVHRGHVRTVGEVVDGLLDGGLGDGI